MGEPGTSSLPRHAREARERSAESPTGHEKSRDWALRFSVGFSSLSADVPSLRRVPADGPWDTKLSVGKKIKWVGAANVGFKAVRLEIMDRTTGAIGVFNFMGGEIGWGLPVDAEIGNGKWQTFRTSAMSLRDFEDVVRFPSAPLGLFQTIQFTNVDVKRDGFFKNLWYGDGVDISDAARGLDLELSYSVGWLGLLDLRWGDLDPKMEQQLRAADFKEAFSEVLNEFVDLVSSSQLPADVHIPGDVDEFLEQQSLPDPGQDPVAELQHQLEEMETEASLLYPGEREQILEDETSWLPEDAPADWGDSQTRDYLGQASQVPDGVDPVASLDHALSEQDAAQSLPSEHELAEQDAQQSLLTDQQIVEQQEVVEHLRAEEEAGQSLVTDSPAVHQYEQSLTPEGMTTDQAAAPGEEAAEHPAATASDPPAGSESESPAPSAAGGDGGTSTPSAEDGEAVCETDGADPVAALDQELAEQDAQMSIEGPQEAPVSSGEGAVSSGEAAEVEPGGGGG